VGGLRLVDIGQCTQVTRFLHDFCGGSCVRKTIFDCGMISRICRRQGLG